MCTILNSTTLFRNNGFMLDEVKNISLIWNDIKTTPKFVFTFHSVISWSVNPLFLKSKNRKEVKLSMPQLPILSEFLNSFSSFRRKKISISLLFTQMIHHSKTKISLILFRPASDDGMTKTIFSFFSSSLS